MGWSSRKSLTRAMKLVTLVALICGVEALTSRFKSLKCISLNESVVFNNCYIRPYSRNYSTMNFAFTHKLAFEAPLKVSVQKTENLSKLSSLIEFRCLQFDVMIKYRYGTIFRQIFHAQIDWCDVMGQINGNKLVMKITELLKKSVPEIFRPCPRPAVNQLRLSKDKFISFLLQGRFDLVNMTLNDNMWLVPIPQGLYRHEYTIIDTLFFAFNSEAVSDLKTSW